MKGTESHALVFDKEGTFLKKLSKDKAGMHHDKNMKNMKDTKDTKQY